MLKFLHIADLHLDSRFVGVSASESVSRRNEMRKVLKNALDFASVEGCDAVLISGDLFDSELYTKDTLDFLRESFASMPDCKFIITPGNHDPYNSASPYRLSGFSDNVTVFDSEELTAVSFDELDLTVYGYAFTSSVYKKSPLDGFSMRSKTKYNVLCAHTDLDVPTSPYAPIQSSQLEKAGFDYAALGHIHTSEDIVKTGKTVYAYSGCIAGRDFSEHGEKGAILVSMDVRSGKKRVRAERVRFCPWVYRTESIDLTDTASEEEAISLIGERIKPYCITEEIEYIFRLRLTGDVSYDIDAALLRQRFAPLGVAEIVSETVNSYGSLALDEDYSLRGEFYRILKPMLLSENIEERKRASRALKYGLSALSGSEIDI